MDGFAAEPAGLMLGRTGIVVDGIEETLMGTQRATSEGFEGWDADELADRLEGPETEGRVFRVTGVRGSTILRDLSETRRRLEQTGREVLVLDPTGAVGDGESLRAVASEYARRVERNGGLDEESNRLVDFVASSRSREAGPREDAMSGDVFRDAVCRLWAALSRQVPSTLLVFHLHECTPSELALLEHFVSEFFADPVSDFVPEVRTSERVSGSLVLVGEESREGLEIDESLVESIDVSGGAKESIRETLKRDNVVEKVLHSTGGDPERVDALIESLPSDCENFWHYRYRQLDEEARRVLQVVAVADEPVSAETLERALEALTDEISISGTIRRLTEEGYLERRIEASTVQLQITDREFKELLVDTLDGERRRRLHLAVAEAANSAQLGGATDRFLARHYLAAGERERGFEYGMRAARRLHGQHALSEARELFETLLEYAEEEGDVREIRSYLLDIHAALGNQDRAVDEIQKLEEQTEDPSESRRLKCKRGELLVKAGSYEEACELFDAVGSDSDDADVGAMEARARFGEAEAAYLRGEHAEATEAAEQTLEMLDACDEESAAAGRTRILARNLLGRLALYKGDHESARPLFEQNLATGRERGWRDEVGRAELNLAVLDLQEGDYAGAVETLDELRRRTPGPRGAQRAALLINLGMAAQRDGAYGEALDHYRAAVRESERVDYEEALGAAAYNLATIFQDLGAYDRVLSIIERLVRRQLDQHRHMFLGPLPEILQANVHIEKGEYLEALELLDKFDAEAEAGRVANAPAARARLRAVQAHLGLDQVDCAREIVDELEVPDEGTGGLEGLYETAKAGIRLAEGSAEEAASLAKGAVENLQQAGCFQDAVRASILRAKALIEAGRSGEAHSVVDRYLASFQDRAASIPDEFHEDFYSIPAYRELVELSRELDGDTPEPFRKFVESQGDEETPEPQIPEREDDAFRRWRQRYSEIIGEDDRLLKIFRRIDQVAGSDSPVLIQGESGTGKELVAEAIHSQGGETGEEPFVKVNCGAFVDNLLLSELFGHEKGAFTGAVEQKVGRFERADGGTIFLDEIGEISKKAQVALLRVLQEGEFERVGGTETKHVDVRVICATNRDLEAAVESGEFRLDLYYRLKGVLLELPPLRDRKQDIPRLVRHFARTQSPEGEAPREFDRDVMEFLASYSWPGNIRELKNFVRSILLFVDGETVDMEHLRGFRDFFSEGELELEAPNIDYEVPVGDYEVEAPADIGDTFEDPEEALVDEIVTDGLDLSELKERIEYESIRKALKKTGGNITQAAEILQMTRPRLSQIVNSDDGLVELKERLVG